LSLPALGDVQRCVCDALFAAVTAASDCHGGDDNDSNAKFWCANCALADLFTGGSFGSPGEM
jgi:hypothetical protein